MSASDPVDPAASTTAIALDQRFATRIKPLLAQHCMGCHGDGKAKGGFSLDGFTSHASIQAQRKTWTHVADVLGQKLMPPQTKPALEADDLAALTTWITDALAFCDCSGPRDPGRGSVRRLNRAEYSNTIRDLVGIGFRASDDFPADDTGYGFDNIGDVLSTSPLLIEKYLAAAEQIVERAARNDNPRRYAALQLQPTGEGNFKDMIAKDMSMFVDHRFPIDGTYEFRIRINQEESEGPGNVIIELDDIRLSDLDVKASRNRPHTVSYRTAVKTGIHRVEARIGGKGRGKNRDRNLVIDLIEIEGPLGVPPTAVPGSRHLAFGKGLSAQSGEDAVRAAIAGFAARAFRRPVTASDIDPLLALYRAARSDGQSVDGGVAATLAAILCSPDFLFRVEAPPPAAAPGSSHAVDSHALAARLSYFLWSAPPDDPLRQLADQGRLGDPETLADQAQRLLRDAKAQALVGNFLGQWLELRRLDEVLPDSKVFRIEIGGELRAAMRQETELFFSHLMASDRSLLDLIDGDYTFLNEILARHYGIAGIEGREFREVKLKGSKRAGILTHASVLMITSTPTRTSPVMRGRFILEQFLDAAPPPPPPDVPDLNEAKVVHQGERLTLRRKLEVHRAEPRCAVCHYEMDAMGFALEGFDGIGRGRMHDEARMVIDDIGALPDGTRIEGAKGLRAVLMARRERFMECLTGKLLTYALGRGLEPYDQCTVKDIAKQAAAKGYRFSALINAMVTSDAFMRVRAAPAGETTALAKVGGHGADTFRVIPPDKPTPATKPAPPVPAKPVPAKPGAPAKPVPAPGARP